MQTTIADKVINYNEEKPILKSWRSNWWYSMIPFTQSKESELYDQSLSFVTRIMLEKIYAKNIDLNRSIFITEEKNKLDRTLSKILELNKLEVNWDGYGAKSINIDTINAGIKFITLLSEKLFHYKSIKMPPPTVSPCTDGGIDVDWDTEELSIMVNIPQQPNPIYSIYIERGDTKIEMEFHYKGNIDGVLFILSQIV